MLFQVPGQDVTVPIPENAPNEDQVADTGGGILAILANYPTIVAAVICAAILYYAWKNVMLRIIIIAVAAVIVTIMVLKP